MPPELTIEGRLVPLNVWSEINNQTEGHFMERFAPGSLRRSFADRVGSRLRAYFEHGRNRVFGSQPIAEVKKTWEQPDGAWYSAELLDGLPDLFISGLRRGLYGASIGAQIVTADRVRAPRPSDYTPKGLEERKYTEVRAFDISITPKPQYAQTTVALRADYLASSPSPRDGSTIYRFAPIVVAAPCTSLSPQDDAATTWRRRRCRRATTSR